MINFTSVKRLLIPEGKVKSIYRNTDNRLLWKGSYINWVRNSLASDGISIYNSGLGYKDGYRVRSGGAEGTQTGGACTGFIPVTSGDVIRIKGWTRYADPGSSANAINAADSSFSNIGQVGNGNYGIFGAGGSATAYNSSTIADNADGISSWVIPPASTGVAFIRVSALCASAELGSSLIVTINEEIT